jgi:hypothetical protein
MASGLNSGGACYGTAQSIGKVAYGVQKRRFWAEFVARFLDPGISPITPVFTGVEPVPSGPKIGQGELADLDGLKVAENTRSSYFRLPDGAAA